MAYFQLADVAPALQYPTTPPLIALLVSSLSHQGFHEVSLYQGIAGEAQFLAMPRGSQLNSYQVNSVAIPSIQKPCSLIAVSNQVRVFLDT